MSAFRCGTDPCESLDSLEKNEIIFGENEVNQISKPVEQAKPSDFRI